MLRHRQFHTLSHIKSSIPTTLGKGKKKPPQPQSLTILNAKQSNLIKFNPGRKFIPTHTKLSNFNENSTNLLKFQTQLNNNQINTKIHNLKPNKNLISSDEYDHIVLELNSFKLKQLRSYVEIRYKDLKSFKSLTKSKLITRLIQDCWLVEKDSNLSFTNQLIQREFDFTPRQLFILLMQQSFENWIRANVSITVNLEELRVIIKATREHLNYIEISLNKILSNISTSEISLENYLQYNENLQLDEIQKLSGVFFEKINNLDYNMFSLGDKKFSIAKRLLLWGIDHNPFIQKHFHYDQDAKLYSIHLESSLSWNERDRDWIRFQHPKYIEHNQDIKKPESLQLPDVETIYDELNISNTNNTNSITAVSFGQLLFDRSTINDKTPKTIFNTNLPFIKTKLLQLPLYENTDVNYTVDYHSYFVQIRLLPSMSIQNSLNEYPPLEIWFEVDEFDNLDKSSMTIIKTVKEVQSFVNLPNHFTDLKFIKNLNETIVSPMNQLDDSNSQNNNDVDTWLKNQQGVLSFLNKLKINLKSKSFEIPDSVKIQIGDESIEYNYLNLSLRKHLNFKLDDKLLQFATIENGLLGGRTNEVLIIGKEDEMSLEEFESFYKQVGNFIDSCK